MSACRSCFAEILWVGTERGKAMPLDAAPYTGDDPRGLFVIRVEGHREGGTKVIGLAVPPDAFPDEPHYRSHFTTCPDRDKWRTNA